MIPDRWWMVTVRTAAPWDAEMVPATLLEAGARAVVEEGEGIFTAPFEPPEDPDAAALRLSTLMREEAGVQDASLTWRWQPHEDWELMWRQGLGPRRVTDRIVIAPSWDLPPVADGEVLIVVDPGLAFGTAEHATTRGCLRLLDGLVAPGEHLADLGSGSGILAVAAARVGAASVLALESDPWAVQAARENVARNGVEERVTVQEAMVDRALLEGSGPLDGILANIERGIVVPLLPGCAAALRSGGWLVVSGIPGAESGAVVEAAVAAGFRPLHEDREDGWWSGSFRLA